MATGHLLIAEDDPVLRNLYLKKFSMEGYDVRTAEDGEKAITLIDEQQPDLLICDIHMPKVDGFQILQKYPKANRKFPIIMLTNFDQGDFKLRAEELGADNYFVKKDMTIHSLVDMVAKMKEMQK